MSQVAWDSFPALGTTAALFVTEADGLDRARRALEAELAAIDRACSRFRSDSELSRVNRAKGRAIRSSELFVEAVAVALDAARVTDGAVDPTIGRSLRAIGYDCDFADIVHDSERPLRVRAMRVGGWRVVRLDRRTRTIRLPQDVELDLGATAKALAADRAARRAQREIGGGVLVNLGGDLSIAGKAPPEGWFVRVTDDHAGSADDRGQTVRVSAGGLATSSTTVRRWTTANRSRHHIVDPRSGDSAAEIWRTVSVAAGSCVDANVASTAAIVRGESAPAWLTELGLPSRMVSRDGTVVRVGGWPEELPA
jgi:FAD:protein FMN transferase